jgi:hypothetical protein
MKRGPDSSGRKDGDEQVDERRRRRRKRSEGSGKVKQVIEDAEKVAAQKKNEKPEADECSQSKRERERERVMKRLSKRMLCRSEMKARGN